MDLGKINKIIGINIDKNKYINILKKLSFEIQDNKILVPTFRHDISTQNDLAEEVASFQDTIVLRPYQYHCKSAE